MTYTRHLPLQAVLNLRDLGGYATANGETPWGRTWRSSSLHKLTEAEIARLETMGLARVIDLRFDDEIAKEPNPFADRPGPVEHVNISLFAGLDPANPHIVASENPLLSLYVEAVDTAPERFVAVMRQIAGTDAGVMFHCTAGKDRTGLIAAMLLQIAGVPREQIVADYALTATYLTPLVEATRAAVTEQGGDFAQYAPYLEARPDTMHAFLDHFSARHGTSPDYLSRHGLSDDDLDALARRFGAAHPQQGAA